MENGVLIGNLNIPAIEGKEGKQGKDGKSAKIIKILVHMLEPNESPTAKNTGTETEAILELGIPKADDITDISINESGTLIFLLRSGRPVEAGKVKFIKDARIEEGQLIFTLLDESQINAGIIYDDELCKKKIDEYNQNAEEKLSIITAFINRKTEIIENISKEVNLNKEIVEQAKNEISSIKNELLTTFVELSNEEIEKIINMED